MKFKYKVTDNIKNNPNFKSVYSWKKVKDSIIKLKSAEEIQLLIGYEITHIESEVGDLSNEGDRYYGFYNTKSYNMYGYPSINDLYFIFPNGKTIYLGRNNGYY